MPPPAPYYGVSLRDLLPALAVVARVTGRIDLALATARVLGGRDVILHDGIDRRHPLAQLIGHRAALLVAADPLIVASRRTGTRAVPWPAASSLWRRAETRRLRAHGWTWPAISRHLDVPESTLRKYLNGWTVTPRPPGEAPRGADPDIPRCPVCGRPRRRRRRPPEPAPLPLLDRLT